MNESLQRTSEPSRRDGLLVTAVVVSLLAFLAGGIATGLAARAVADSKGGGTTEVAAAAKPVAATEAPEVSLSEFAIKPAVVQAVVGSTVKVFNDGSSPHNLSVKGTDKKTPDFAPKDSGELDLRGLDAGTYQLLCSVPGHEASGMVGELRLLPEGGSEAAAAAPATATGAHEGMDHASAATMTPDEMDETMKVRTAAFPAKTQGQGAQELAPTVLPDGTKQFELTTKVVQWEVEPGKTVEAWTYNGTVPGPTLRAGVGDKVRVVLHNELPESTAIHFHGLDVPNAQDGVPDITQEPVKPGQRFTYEFVAHGPTGEGPAVGMYHSHHNAAKQVPNGLAGAFLVGDLALPNGVKVAQEVPMMLNDAGTIGFSLNGKSFPATAPVVAKQGDWILTHYLNEGLTAHPMHLHGQPQMVVAKDGVPVPEPYWIDSIDVAPGERYSVLAQAKNPGTWAWHCHILTHAEKEDGMFGMVTALVVR